MPSLTFFIASGSVWEQHRVSQEKTWPWPERPLVPGMLLRIADLQPYVRLSRATILALEAQGRFPRAARMNCRVTQYQSSDVIEFLADPAGYRAPGLDSSASATCGEAE